MKFLTRRKKKEKSDEDLYQPPRIEPHAQPQSSQHDPHRQQLPSLSEAGSTHSSYRYALQAYASTISPALSNEDGFGGSGTLRSRSTKSGGKKHCTLIPVFPLTPSSSEGGVEMDRYSFSFDQINEQVEAGMRAIVGEGEGERWAPIPEEPRSPGDVSTENQNYHRDDENGEEEEEDGVGQEQVIGQSSSEAHSDQRMRSTQSSSIATETNDNNNRIAPSINFQTSTTYIPLNNDSPNNNIISPSSSSIQSQYTKINQHSPSSLLSSDYPNQRRLSTKVHPIHNNKSNLPNLLQPDAIYEEHYGDAYIDSHIKYLYPSGYQSMRPRSGPWKLSIFIFLLFLWLSVFIVGHCYDRGQEYNIYFGSLDDAYLSEVDDDTLVMETRWCGSKLIYIMWFVCVSITMLSMSYCSIIGYIKLRDVAVANGRSQPTGSSFGRSDCYADVDNVKKGYNNDDCKSTTAGSEAGSGSTYSSYQDGGVARRYPSIYQSDGTPQFWGGHIYRPMQAAVSMTNR
jgi:hypothetical protein